MAEEADLGFFSWLISRCQQMGLDSKNLTSAQRDSLRREYDELQKQEETRAPWPDHFGVP